jgi:hypothetical protein
VNAEVIVNPKTVAILLLLGCAGTDCGYPNVRFWQILLQKSFGGDERIFLGSLMRFVRRDVRDHIAYQKNDHGASYRPCGALQR